MGFALPDAIARPAVRSYRTFSPLLAPFARTSGIFSVALSVTRALSAHPRPLAGMPPYEDRTFLSTDPKNGPIQRLPNCAGKLQYAIFAALSDPRCKWVTGAACKIDNAEGEF